MKKWILISWMVLWMEPQPRMVPCPNAQPMTDNNGITFVSACLTQQSWKEFKSKKEAEEFAKSFTMLTGNKQVQIKEAK